MRDTIERLNEQLKAQRRSLDFLARSREVAGERTEPPPEEKPETNDLGEEVSTQRREILAAERRV